MSGTLRALQVLSLSLFIGGAALLFLAVAPGAFSVLPTPLLAGRVVGHVLRFLDAFALAAMPVLLVLAVVDERARASRNLVRWARGACLAVPLAAAALSRFWLVPRIEALRDHPSYPGTAALPWAGKSEFGMLHGISSSLALLALLCAVAALLLAIRLPPRARD